MSGTCMAADAWQGSTALLSRQTIGVQDGGSRLDAFGYWSAGWKNGWAAPDALHHRARPI